jgi:hypothetical protein
VQEATCVPGDNSSEAGNIAPLPEEDEIALLDQEKDFIVKRWSAEHQSMIEVPCPEIVHQYNKHMGGVDLCDMLLALYRIKVGTRKWSIYCECMAALSTTL